MHHYRFHLILPKASPYTLTVEYLPSELNKEADFQSRHVEDRSDWKLNPSVFRSICEILGTPSIDLFASRVSFQLMPYMSLKHDHLCLAVDAFQQDWSDHSPYAFPPFNLVGRVLVKAKKHKIDMVLIASVWVSQPWYPKLLSMLAAEPILLEMKTSILKSPREEIHPLVHNQTLQLAAWPISGQKEKVRSFQQELTSLSQLAEARALELITTQPGRNFVAGVVKSKLIQFIAL